MLTRCPHCQTAFRVSSEQLTLRQGRVRCGECRSVFNALASLTDEVLAAPPLAPLPAEALPVEEAPVEEAPAEEAPVEEAPAEEAPAEEAPAEDAPAEDAPAEDAPAEDAPAEERPEDRPPEEVSQETAAALPASWEEAPDRPRPRRWPWLLASLPLILLAVGQLLYIYRAELAVQSPALRPLLADACAALGCTLPRPRQPELVGIESSDLAPEGGERLLLTASLRNRAPFAQDYPHLELTLTDTRDSAILRKLLAPADYLDAAHPEAAGFAPQGEVAVKLLLEAKGVPAVGYRLYLFYP